MTGNKKMPDVHVFLDTNILFDDPYFKKDYNSLLFELASSGDATIYLSSIVLDELRYHFERNIEQHLTKFYSALETVKRHIDNQLDVNLFDKTVYIKQFAVFYEKYTPNAIRIVPTPNEILPEIIRRSVNRIKPFSENKPEFRDAAIWLSCASFAKKENLEKCFFITNNVRDFFNTAKNEIHQDLKPDFPNVTAYRDAKSFFETEKWVTERKNRPGFAEWFEGQQFSEQDLINLLETKFKGEINHKSNWYITTMDPNGLLYAMDDIYIEDRQLLKVIHVKVTGKQAYYNLGILSCEIEYIFEGVAFSEDWGHFPVENNGKIEKWPKSRDIELHFKAEIYFSLKQGEELDFGTFEKIQLKDYELKPL